MSTGVRTGYKKIEVIGHRMRVIQVWREWVNSHVRWMTINDESIHMWQSVEEQEDQIENIDDWLFKV